jgi:hypothetical protein
VARERLWERQDALHRKIEAQEARGPDHGRLQEIADLEWELDQKRQEIERKKRELKATRSDAAEYDPAKL